MEDDNEEMFERFGEEDIDETHCLRIAKTRQGRTWSVDLFNNIEFPEE